MIQSSELCVKVRDWLRVVLHYVERLELALIGRQRCHQVSESENENYSLRDLQEVNTAQPVISY